MNHSTKSIPVTTKQKENKMNNSTTSIKNAKSKKEVLMNTKTKSTQSKKEVLMNTKTKSTQSIFVTIKNAIKYNLLNERSNSKYANDVTNVIELNGKYDWFKSAIVYLAKNSCFSIESIKEFYEGRTLMTRIVYKNLNLEHPFFKGLEMFLGLSREAYNDRFRYDDLRMYSSDDMVNGAMFENGEKYTYLSKEDSCTFQLFLNSLGYANYQAFISDKHAFDNNTLESKYKAFLCDELAPDYQFEEVHTQ